MEATLNTPALILNSQPYREADTLVSVYSLLKGKLSLVARGTKKQQSKLAGHLEPLSLVDILIIPGRGFDYIGSAAGRDSYLNIKDDLNKIYYAGRAINLFSRLVKEGFPDERLFKLLKSWLEVLDKAGLPGEKFDKASGELLSIFFILKFLEELGYRPEISKCLKCQADIKPGGNYFHLQGGGLVCGDCFATRKDWNTSEIMKISDNSIKLIRFIASGNFDQAKKMKISERLLKDVSLLLNNFIKYNF